MVQDTQRNYVIFSLLHIFSFASMRKWLQTLVLYVLPVLICLSALTYMFYPSGGLPQPANGTKM